MIHWLAMHGLLAVSEICLVAVLGELKLELLLDSSLQNSHGHEWGAGLECVSSQELSSIGRVSRKGLVCSSKCMGFVVVGNNAPGIMHQKYCTYEKKWRHCIVAYSHPLL